jgi:hypothetical protein
MTYSHRKHWPFYIFIIGVCSLTVHSYGDFEYMNNNDQTTSQQVNFGDLIESVRVRHRVRRSINASFVADTSTSKCSLYLTQFYNFFSMESS